MKIFLLFLLPFSLFALNKNSCYTVQLLSTVTNEKNLQQLQLEHFDSSCKIMNISNRLTVRCGCFEKYKEVKKHYKKLKQHYKEAYIATTYKSRFKPKEENKSTKKTLPVKLEILEPVEPLVINTPTIQKPKIQKKDTTKTTKKLTRKKEKKKKTTKKEIYTQNKNKEIKEHKKKKKKKKKVKYVKKKSSVFFYDRYIDMLSNEKGIGKYDYRYSFGAEFSYDIGYISEADDAYFDKKARRIRISHSGSMFKEHLFYQLEYSFTGNNQYKDVYLGYKDRLFNMENTSYRIRFGNIKIPFALERYTASKYNTFMERGLNKVFYTPRKLGLELLLSKKIEDIYLNGFGAYFTNSINERLDNQTDKSGYALRMTLANKFTKHHLYEFGFGLKNEDNKGEKIRLKQGAESSLIKNKYVSTKIKDVDDISTLNLEALYIYNKYYLQGEYTTQTLKAAKGVYNFYAYYLQGSYFLLGRGKRYNFTKSTLAKVKPTQEGAIELALRYSGINLNDKDEQGGEQYDYTLGINWYIDDKLRISGNYILANPRGTDDYDGVFQIWQARVLFFF